MYKYNVDKYREDMKGIAERKRFNCFNAAKAQRTAWMHEGFGVSDVQQEPPWQPYTLTKVDKDND